MATQEVLSKVDLSQYKGQWVVLCDGSIIAHDKNITRIEKEIDTCKKTPTIVKIPNEEILIFYGNNI